jgi:small-conductance mechanosensitive channel
VPNQKFITDNVTNYLYLKQSVRLRVPVPIAAGQDIRRAETLLLDAARQADVLADPAPQVAITSLSATAVSLELWVWYDGKAFARPELLSRVYFKIVDTLIRNDVKLAG